MSQSLPETSEPAGESHGLDPAELWTQFGPPLHRFLARRTPPGVDADDLVQDVFVRVIRSFGSLRSTDRPEAWLFQIARNALHDVLRARLRRDGRTDAIDVDLPAEETAEATRSAEAELAPCLTGMVDRLAEPYRSALSLTSLQGLTQADAARQLGISVSGMKSRVQRGREHLRQLLVRCCAVDTDVRGGVSDFWVREPSACGAPSSSAAGGCGGGTCTAPKPAESSRRG